MFNLEMDILIIVIHMFLSFSTSAVDGITFFVVSETKQSYDFQRVAKTQKWVVAKGFNNAALRHKKREKVHF